MRNDPPARVRVFGELPVREIDRICDEFEAKLKRGERPRIEDYLVRIAPPQRSELLCELIMLELSYFPETSPESYYDRFPAEHDAVKRALQTFIEYAQSEETGLEPVYAAPAPEPPDLSAAFPELTDRYDEIQEVDHGNMGVVYRAHDKLLDMHVAIKVLQPGRSTTRFLREAQILARIVSEHVVRFFDLRLLTGDYPVLVMEWVDGVNLYRTISDHTGPLPEERVLPWMMQTCKGMLAAADQGIVHRDLKPSNILIDSSGRARVADFGLARAGLLPTDLSGSSQMMGTPWYMAPEQAEDPKGVDERSDVYSFGATFYHALTGRRPFDGPTPFSVLLKHRTEPLTPPIVRNPQLSQRSSDLIERCLAKKPAERFQSFVEVLNELQRTDDASPWETQGDHDLLPYILLYRHRRDAYLDARNPFRRIDTYDFPGGRRRLLILDGDITRQEVDAIVSSTDETISARFGVSRAIRAGAGAEVFEEARRFKPVRPGRVVVTSAGNLKARFIFHGITSGHVEEETILPSRDLISEIVANCFYHAESFNVRSIAFPLLGSTAMGFPRDVCLDTMFRVLARTLQQGVTPIDDVRIVLAPEPSAIA